MRRMWQWFVFMSVDCVMIFTAFFVWHGGVTFELGLPFDGFINNVMVWIAIFGFWFSLFLLFGLYRPFIRSRTDEFIAIVKTVTVGIFILFLVSFDIRSGSDRAPEVSRFRILLYWTLMVVLTGIGRLLLRTLIRKLLERGIGRRRAVIVGTGEKARSLLEEIERAPALGYQILGFVTISETIPEPKSKLPIVGRLSEMHSVLKEYAIQEVLIAVSSKSVKLLEEIIAQCNGVPVGMKIVPDLYHIIVGQVRTNQIYGFPLIEILPHFMQPWELALKRLNDILFSLIILIGLLPLWILFTVVIPLDSRGSIFYIQERVGKGGKLYKMIKFRSMVEGAEKMTGPIWASYKDPRVTRFGRFMRRLRLDEIPQLLNVLKGDMSWVGPRPERPYFVDKFKKEIPLYGRRLLIRPGITGWAQVKGHYDQSLEHVKQKLEYDLFYLENMSARMDLKILLNTLYVMLCGKGF